MTDPLEELILADKWFYRFPLPSGRQTESFVGEDKLVFHQNRLDMAAAAIERTFGPDWSNLSCIDLGAHQGFFAFHMAERGFASVLGLEARAEHVAKAEMIRDVHGLKNLKFHQGDAMQMAGLKGQEYDVVLMLGLVYHLDNPIGALRMAAASTTRLLLVETQIIPNMSGIVDWGSHEHCKPLMGVFGIINEGQLIHSDGVTGIALVPSLEGLLWLLDKLGFTRVEVLPPPPEAYCQLRTGKRVMVAAWKE